MRTNPHFRRGVLLAALWAAFVSTPAPVAAQPVPADFQVVARYAPGYSNWRSWTTTITGDGKALQKIGMGGRGGGEPSEKKSSLSKDDLKALLSQVKEADFFKLKGKYRGTATDQATLTLEVTLGKKTHTVSVYGFRFLRDKEDRDEVDRFLKVWVEVLKKVPSPNPEQLDLYQAGGGGKKKPPPSAQRPRLRATLRGHTDAVVAVAFSPDSKTLASASYDGTLKLWDMATGKERATLGEYRGCLGCVAFSPDGKTLASGAIGSPGYFPDLKNVKLWDVATGKVRTTLKGDTFHVHSVAFSPDGKTLASVNGDVTLWDLATNKKRATLQGHTKEDRETSEPIYVVQAVAFSPDGKTLAAASHDMTVKVWDVATAKRSTLPGHTHAAYAVAFSTDSKTLASASGDKTVRLWDLATSEERATLQGHAEPVTSVAFSPYGKTLASGSGDKTVKLWDVATGKERATLRGHEGMVYSVAFSPDGKTLASGSGDKTVKLWDVATGKVYSGD